jgi:hypothetical protein
MYDHYPLKINDLLYKILKKQYPDYIKFEISKFEITREDLNNYSFTFKIPNEQIKSSDKKWFDRSEIIVTSGILSPYFVLDSKDKMFQTDTYNFRLLLNPHYIIIIKNSHDLLIQKIAWKDYSFSATVKIDEWILNSQSNSLVPEWSGVHLFARYITENDLYVASIRKDGQVVIKKKLNGIYTTLSTTKYSSAEIGASFSNYIQLKKWYTFKITIVNLLLSFYINDTLILQALDDSQTSINSGTSGIRFDYVKASIRDGSLLVVNT